MGADTGYPAVQGPGHADVEMQAPAPAAVAVQYAGLYPTPVEGIPVKGPARAPGLNEVVLGYEICEPKTGCCQCAGLTQAGVMAVIILVIMCPCAHALLSSHAQTT